MLRIGDKVKVFQTRANNVLEFMVDGVVQAYNPKGTAEVRVKRESGAFIMYCCIVTLPSPDCDWDLKYNVAIRVEG